MATVEWNIFEYPGCLGSCVCGWRELEVLVRRRAQPRVGGRVLLVPGYGGGGLPDTDDEVLLDRLRAAHADGVLVATVCAGAAWAAAAGLDRGRPLTTHWSLATELSALRPGLRVDSSRLVIDHGDLVSAGGLLAWVDLGLHLVERFWGSGPADEVARTLVWERGRTLQTPYAPPGETWKPLRPDPVLEPALAWIARRLREEATTVEEWAGASALGLRSFQRRWTAAFGRGPLRWLQDARVEEARRLLETGADNWEAITARCGYRDPGSFRALFEERVGWTPGRYRRSLGRPGREGQPPDPQREGRTPLPQETPER